MALGNAINGRFYSFVSEGINLKTVGDNLVFSTFATVSFVPISIGFACVSSTTPNGDSVFNLGWTAPNYDDYISGGSIAVTVANTSEYQGVTGPDPVFPAATDIYLRVTSADTGTAIQVRAIITGYYITL